MQGKKLSIGWSALGLVFLGMGLWAVILGLSSQHAQISHTQTGQSAEDTVWIKKTDSTRRLQIPESAGAKECGPTTDQEASAGIRELEALQVHVIESRKAQENPIPVQVCSPSHSQISFRIYRRDLSKVLSLGFTADTGKKD